jgi:hypothetical protein
MAVELPKKTVRMFVEHKGIYEDVEVEDRPTRLVENQFNESKGIYEDIEVPLTDEEILAIGLKAAKPKKKAKKKVSKKK